MTEFSIWGDHVDGKPLNQMCNARRGASLEKSTYQSTFGNNVIGNVTNPVLTSEIFLLQNLNTANIWEKKKKLDMPTTLECFFQKSVCHLFWDRESSFLFICLLAFREVRAKVFSKLFERQLKNNMDIQLFFMGFPSGSVVKNPPAMQEMWVQSLCQEDPMEEDVETHSSILA